MEIQCRLCQRWRAHCLSYLLLQVSFSIWSVLFIFVLFLFLVHVLGYIDTNSARALFEDLKTKVLKNCNTERMYSNVLSRHLSYDVNRSIKILKQKAFRFAKNKENSLFSWDYRKRSSFNPLKPKFGKQLHWQLPRNWKNSF